jgi:hypothetical protein
VDLSHKETSLKFLNIKVPFTYCPACEAETRDTCICEKVETEMCLILSDKKKCNCYHEYEYQGQKVVGQVLIECDECKS